MDVKKVKEILIPLKEGVKQYPSVAMGDKIISAIELMLKNDLKNIAVVRNGRPIGMVCLEDAFQVLGLRVPPQR